MKNVSGRAALVVSSVALVAATTTGGFAAGAHLGKHSVGTKQLKKNAVGTANLKNGSVTGAKLGKDVSGRIAAAAKAPALYVASAQQPSTTSATPGLKSSTVSIPAGVYKIDVTVTSMASDAWGGFCYVRPTASAYMKTLYPAGPGFATSTVETVVRVPAAGVASMTCQVPSLASETMVLQPVTLGSGSKLPAS